MAEVKLKHQFTWSDVRTRAVQIANLFLKERGNGNTSHVRIYGVPRGGIPVALAVDQEFDSLGISSTLLENPDGADLFVDDIIDSGRTKKHFQSHLDIPFYALVDKPAMSITHPLKNQWIEFPWERMSHEAGVEDNIVRILQYIGEDPKREGLLETPKRVIKSWGKIYGGYKQDPADIMKTFNEPCDELVVVKDIEFYSNCEHHMQPFFGKAHIGYIPSGKVLGVSKFARLIEIYARRLQIQERIGQQVADAIEKYLKPQGIAVVLEAKHFCMTCRGVEKQNSIMKTSCMRGVLRDKPEARAEFLEMIR